MPPLGLLVNPPRLRWIYFYMICNHHRATILKLMNQRLSAKELKRDKETVMHLSFLRDLRQSEYRPRHDYLQSVKYHFAFLRSYLQKF